jgi:hypothetical protein
MNLSESSIDSSLLDSDEPVILAEGGSKTNGYKHSKFYNLKLYYIPSVDRFVLSKSSILGVNLSSFGSLAKAIHRYNEFCEDSYTEKPIADRYDVADYVIEEAKE